MKILTDSRSIQKGAYFHLVPCITLSDETEWVETVEACWNLIVGADENAFIKAVRNAKRPPTEQTALYGDGHAADKAVQLSI